MVFSSRIPVRGLLSESGRILAHVTDGFLDLVHDVPVQAPKTHLFQGLFSSDQDPVGPLALNPGGR